MQLVNKTTHIFNQVIEKIHYSTEISFLFKLQVSQEMKEFMWATESNNDTLLSSVRDALYADMCKDFRLHFNTLHDAIQKKN